jgi:hypothetical protein
MDVELNSQFEEGFRLMEETDRHVFVTGRAYEPRGL